MNNSEEIYKWIEEQGWKTGFVNQNYDLHNKVWYKQYPNVKPNCFGNSDKPLQLILKCWNYDKKREISFTVELIAEPDDGVWIHFIIYTLTINELKEQLDKQVQKLIRAWISCQSKRKTI